METPPATTTPVIQSSEEVNLSYTRRQLSAAFLNCRKSSPLLVVGHGYCPSGQSDSQSEHSGHSRAELLSSGECSAASSPSTTPPPTAMLVPYSILASTSASSTLFTVRDASAVATAQATVHHGACPETASEKTTPPPRGQQHFVPSNDEVGACIGVNSDTTQRTLELAASRADFISPAYRPLVEHLTLSSTTTVTDSARKSASQRGSPPSPSSQPSQMALLSLISKRLPHHPTASPVLDERPPVITRSLVAAASIHNERTGAFDTVPTKHPSRIAVVPMPSVITPLRTSLRQAPPSSPSSAVQSSTSPVSPPCPAATNSITAQAPTAANEDPLAHSSRHAHMIIHRPTPTRMGQVNAGAAGNSSTGQVAQNVPPSQLIARSMRAGATLTGSFTRKPCPYCVNKSFPSYKDLERHLRTHTGERPYPCNMCDYRARQRGALRNHMSKKHGVQMPHLPPV